MSKSVDNETLLVLGTDTWPTEMMGTIDQAILAWYQGSPHPPLEIKVEASLVGARALAVARALAAVLPVWATPFDQVDDPTPDYYDTQLDGVTHVMVFINGHGDEIAGWIQALRNRGLSWFQYQIQTTT